MGIRHSGSLRAVLAGSLLFSGALTTAVVAGIAGPATPAAAYVTPSCASSPVAHSGNGSEGPSAGTCGPGAGAETTALFHIVTTSLPKATPGTPYTGVTLQAADVGVSASPYTTTVKWKKISLPKGLKLSTAGVLFGTPSPKLTAGSTKAEVQATERVITLNGKKRIRTKTTVQATIPLTIT